MLGSLHADVQTMFPPLDLHRRSRACAVDPKCSTVTYPARVGGDTDYGIFGKYRLYRSCRSYTKAKTQIEKIEQCALEGCSYGHCWIDLLRSATRWLTGIPGRQTQLEGVTSRRLRSSPCLSLLNDSTTTQSGFYFPFGKEN